MKALFYSFLVFFILTSAWLFTYSSHYYFMIFIHLKNSRKKKEECCLSENPAEYPMVTIQLPIFNEMFVAERLIRRVAEIDYPKDKLEIQVLDDSTDETIIITKNVANELRENGFNIKWIHRKDRSGYKGGALKEALAVCEGEFVAVFDADFLPPKNFLKKTVPHFDSDEIGMVQCRWTFMNPDYNFLTQLQRLSLDGHFVLEQKGRHLAGHYFSFNGSAGIWRKATIYDAGDWNGETLTEDLDLSYRAQFNGWKFKYLPEVEIPSELPVMMAGYKSQQFRWAKGFIQCTKKLFFPVLKNKASAYKKLEGLIHLTSHLSYLVMALHLILSLPMVFLMRKYGEIVNSPILFILLSFFMFSGMCAPLVFLVISQKIQKNSVFRTILRLPAVFFMNFGLIVHLSKAIIEAIAGKKSGFVRTPKFNIKNNEEKNKAGRKYKDKAFDFSTLMELVAIAYAGAAFVLSIVYKIYFTTGLSFAFIIGLSMVAGTTIIQHYRTVFKAKRSEDTKRYHVQWIHPSNNQIPSVKVNDAQESIEIK
jgi:cellulose synthase/poly-beta-1,6-N-acetylglucosamine synthase-like glycosyltransferase